MRSIAVFLCLLTFPIWGQEVVASFPRGSGPNQLGLESRLATSGEYLSEATGLGFDGNRFYVTDGVNSRILVLDNTCAPVASKPIERGVLANLWVDSSLIATGWNPAGPDKFWLTTIIDKKDFSKPPVTIEAEHFLKDYELYGYLGLIGGIAYFQGENGEYFGVRINSNGALSSAEVVLENGLRHEFESVKQARFRWEGGQFFDHDQLISSSRKVFGPFLKGLPEFNVTSAGPYTSSRFFPLPNGNYLLTYAGSCRVFDTSGRKVITEVLDYSASQFAPSPDGYLYFLHPDYDNNKTDLMRLGPYPEVRLDYHGRGGTVNDDTVNLREEANVKSMAVTKLAKGTPVRILGQTDKPETIAGQKGLWYQVRLWDRTEGWVFGAFLDVK